MIALPLYDPCGVEGAGDREADSLSIVCTHRVTFEPDGKKKFKATLAPGCGAVSTVCGRCGVRAKWNDGPCVACEKRTE